MGGFFSRICKIRTQYKGTTVILVCEGNTCMKICSCGYLPREKQIIIIPSHKGNNIRIYHECEDRIEKSVTRITVWHKEACRVM